MAHTFDIRFARAGGFTAFLEAPANTFHWKGSGTLSIDAEGLSIAVLRGLFSLFPRSRRVAAADLTEVLREGEALRIEFITETSARAVVPFWVRDAKTAEEIVRLLPTQRTVELDHDAAGVAGSNFRIDWRALAMFALVAAATIGGFLLWIRPATPFAAPADPSAEKTTPQAAASEVENGSGARSARPGDRVPPRQARPAAPLDVPNPYPPYGSARQEIAKPTPAQRIEPAHTDTNSHDLNGRVRAGNGIVSIEPDMPEYAAARRQLDLFKQETNELIAASRNGVNYDDSWWKVTVRISNDPELDRSDLWALREMELAVSRAWRGYVYALTYVPEAAEPSREMAERLTARLDQYVR